MNEQTQNDGGHAFPTIYTTEEVGNGYKGMSLRDYFAAQALANAALFTYSGRMEGEENREWLEWQDHKELFAKNAYFIADQMLKSRAAK